MAFGPTDPAPGAGWLDALWQRVALDPSAATFRAAADALAPHSGRLGAEGAAAYAVSLIASGDLDGAAGYLRRRGTRPGEEWQPFLLGLVARLQGRGTEAGMAEGACADQGLIELERVLRKALGR